MIPQYEKMFETATKRMLDMKAENLVDYIIEKL
jgi:hypothetical protein